MANRPLPNVDPEALSKLASQYPGSGDTRSEPKLGGGPGGGSGGGTGGGTGKVTPSVAAKPEPRSGAGSRSAALLTFVFAVVALAAALAALAAPSLRSEARALLLRHVPQLGASTIDFITGQDTGRLEITYDGLDQRIARLTEALERVVAVQGVDPAAARELLLRTEENQRLGQAEAAVADQGDRLAAAAARIEALDERTATFEELRASFDALQLRADGAEQSMARLQELTGVLESRVTALAEEDGRMGARMEALMAPVEGRLDEMAAEIAAAHAVISPVSALLNDVAEQRISMELPLIGMTQLRIALNRDIPYPTELELAKRLVGDDAESQAALSALDSTAESGVSTVVGLRRDFSFVATQMGGSLMRVQSWTQRLQTWVEVLVGTRAVPEADPIGQISSVIASIDAALEAGQLELAIDEARAFNAARSDVLLENWIAEARRRLATERAFDRLSARIYARIGTAR